MLKTDRVHEEVAVDLSVVLLHFLLNLSQRQLLLSSGDLFILKGTLGALHR